jgi:spermidine synthase
VRTIQFYRRDFRNFHVLYPLIFLSGLSSLIYEIVWIRQASFVFGSSTLAMSTVLAVFFLGLGLGSWLFGRIGSSVKQPLLWCAGIELLLAVNGLCTPALFAWADNFYGISYRYFDTYSALLLLIRASLVGLLLLPPALLMGGTLPLFCRQIIRDPARLSTKLSVIYGVNTAGAAVGCTVSGFLLLPMFGLAASLQVAAGLNVLTGLGFWQLSNKVEPSAPITPSKPLESSYNRRLLLLAGWLFFMIGAAALANELIWARFLSNFIRNSVYTYTITLAVVLIGTAAGSLLLGPYFDRSKNPKALLISFGVLQALSATLLLLLTHLPAPIWQGLQPLGLLPFILLMLPSTFIAGASFPLLNKIVTQQTELASKQIGMMTAVNIAGCIVGSVLTGFWLLPHIGLDAGIFISSAWTLTAAWFAIMFASSKNTPAFKARASIYGGLSVWLLMLLWSPVRIPDDYLAPDDELVSITEGYNSNLAVVLRDNVKTLLIDRLWQGVETSNYQVMVAHIPMLHYPEAKDVLVIGLGAGNTARRFLRYDIAQLDIVDIEPRLFDFTREHFPSRWMNDPRVNLIAEDGRNYVKHTGRNYDFISVEIGQLDRPGVSVFYTEEFYQQAAAKLNANGMISQFVPLSFLRPAEFASVLKTFLAVFPNAQLWYNTDELLLIGFKGNIRQLSPEGFAKVTEEPSIGADFDLKYWGGDSYNLNSFPVFLGSFLASGAELNALANIAPATHYTDDKLQLSYSVSDFQHTDQRASALVPFIQQHLTPITAAFMTNTATDIDLQTAAKVRDLNLADIIATDILGAADEHDSIASRIQRAQQALRINPKNIDAQNELQRAEQEQNKQTPVRPESFDSAQENLVEGPTTQQKHLQP